MLRIPVFAVAFSDDKNIKSGEGAEWLTHSPGANENVAAKQDGPEGVKGRMPGITRSQGSEDDQSSTK